MSKFDPTNIDAMNRDNRAMQAQGLTHSMPEILDDLYALILAGSIGITAVASDVDSLALGGGAFTQDTSTTVGLTFGYKAGRFHNGLANVTVGAGTIALSGSNTNYVEVDRSGLVSKNVSGFTSGHLPLWTIVTGPSTITSVAISKPLLQLIGLAGVVGAMLSTMGATKEQGISPADIAATTVYHLVLPANAGNLSEIGFVCGAGVTASDTDYYKFKVINKGAAGSGTTVVVDDTLAANSTKATGGTAIVANVQRTFTLGTVAFAARDVLEITVTKVGTPVTMTAPFFRFDSTFTG